MSTAGDEDSFSKLLTFHAFYRPMANCHRNREHIKTEPSEYPFTYLPPIIHSFTKLKKKSHEKLQALMGYNFHNKNTEALWKTLLALFRFKWYISGW
jgi:hypothetical protein